MVEAAHLELDASPGLAMCRVSSKAASSITTAEQALVSVAPHLRRLLGVVARCMRVLGVQIFRRLPRTRVGICRRHHGRVLPRCR